MVNITTLEFFFFLLGFFVCWFVEIQPGLEPESSGQMLSVSTEQCCFIV